VEDFVIRPATDADIPALERLYEILNRSHVDGQPRVFKMQNRDELRQQVIEEIERGNADGNFLRVAERDGKLAGMVFAVHRPARPGITVLVPRESVFVDELCVMDEFRGTGAANALMRAVDDWAITLDVDLVALNVWSFNSRAIRFYEKLGYEPAHQSMYRWLRRNDARRSR
jgi:GNAT superfamily N-acetyltransferase